MVVTKISFSALPALLLLYIFSQVVQAQNNSTVCVDNASRTYNASSERTIHGFYSNNTYSFTTGIKELRNYTTNQSRIIQDYWLTADPLDTTSWQNLSFGGCVYILSQGATPDLEPNTMIKNPEGVTTCEDVLPKGCYRAWMDQLNTSIANVISNHIHDTELICQSINISMPYQCGTAFLNDTSPISAFGSELPGIPPIDTGGACSADIDVFNGSSTQNIFSRDSSIDLAANLRTDLSTAIGNKTVYNYFVKRTNALFMVAWPRNSEVGADVQPLVNAVCLCPQEHILNGSSDPVNGDDRGAPSADATSGTFLLTAPGWQACLMFIVFSWCLIAI